MTLPEADRRCMLGLAGFNEVARTQALVLAGRLNVITYSH